MDFMLPEVENGVTILVLLRVIENDETGVEFGDNFVERNRLHMGIEQRPTWQNPNSPKISIWHGRVLHQWCGFPKHPLS